MPSPLGSKPPHRLTDVEKRATLLEMPNFGRVTTKGKRIVLDFYPDLKGPARYLQSFAGKAFTDESHAETVRAAICRDARSMGLSEAVAQFRSSRSRANKISKVFEDFYEAVESKRWQSERTGEFLSPRTIGAYKRVLKRAAPYFEGMTVAEATDGRTLRDFKAWFRRPKPDGRGLKSDQETRNAFAALRSVIRWYRVQNPIFQAPDWPPMPTAATAKRKNENERNENRLTLPETVRGIDCIPPERQPLFWVLFYTQARPTEVRGVLGADWKSPTLTIRRSAEGSSSNSGIRDTTKTGESGKWELPGWVCDLIDEHCGHVRFSPRLPLFRNPNPQAQGDIYSYDALRDTWALATAQAEIPWVPVYKAFKHTIVTAFRDSGMDIEEIVAQCRFRSDQMVDVYDQRADERRSGTVSVLDEWVSKARSEQ